MCTLPEHQRSLVDSFFLVIEPRLLKNIHNHLSPCETPRYGLQHKGRKETETLEVSEVEDAGELTVSPSVSGTLRYVHFLSEPSGEFFKEGSAKDQEKKALGSCNKQEKQQ